MTVLSKFVEGGSMKKYLSGGWWSRLRNKCTTPAHFVERRR